MLLKSLSELLIKIYELFKFFTKFEKSQIYERFPLGKMLEHSILGNLRAISPRKRLGYFFDKKCVSASQKHSDFSKKMKSKNNNIGIRCGNGFLNYFPNR